ncbi:protoporphyrinogen oxidase [Streptomyces durbertensis]|uniref:Coproporphyrinogen III oxidase n=1 Tax=Streptomyces durbertensis TaxID=2448886 RepID=A0ABR6EA93_9ACTN|nr:protoporphyrinogen oxidase [Streptomyces durbertensis]MBB1241997.1 protoporphyrinogen oxidase [Streptomyces durbertensis]
MSAPPADARPAGRESDADVLVLGAGVAGLAAAHRLALGGARVTVLEADSRVGGKLLCGEIAGCAVDLGAESMLARRPEAVDLARAVGLGDALRPPAVFGGALWTRGEIRPMPKGHLMGVPGDPASVAGVISPDGLARIAEDSRLPATPLGEDVSIGEYVAQRLGPEVVDRLVEPLLGGVYAGDARRISLRATLPQLYEAARDEPSLLAAVRAVQRAAASAAAPEGAAAEGAATRAAGAEAPVFLGIEGGVGRLPEAVAAAVRAAGGTVRTGVAARALRRTPDGWLVECADGARTARAVVVALPAGSAARLLREAAPTAAAELERVEYASMALCTLAFRRADLAEVPRGSGFLVPPVDGHTIKAATFSSNKWQWVADQDPGLFLLRTSVGRIGEPALLERDDDELVRLSLRDLREATGLAARPVASLVTRWRAGLPQYPVGHLDAVGRVHRAIAELPGLAVCGAAYGGVGIPACVADGHRAADRVAAQPGAAAGAPSAEARMDT